MNAMLFPVPHRNTVNDLHKIQARRDATRSRAAARSRAARRPAAGAPNATTGWPRTDLAATALRPLGVVPRGDQTGGGTNRNGYHREVIAGRLPGVEGGREPVTNQTGNKIRFGLYLPLPGKRQVEPGRAPETGPDQAGRGVDPLPQGKGRLGSRPLTSTEWRGCDGSGEPGTPALDPAPRIGVT